METPINLDACPFCKQPAKLIRNRLWWREYGFEGKHSYYVGCVNPTCKIQPHTKTHDDIHVETDVAINNAIRDWNKGEVNK